MKAFDLRMLARRAMTDAGFTPDLPPDSARELHSIGTRQHAPPSGSLLPDLRRGLNV